jgi:hypothetical protein
MELRDAWTPPDTSEQAETLECDATLRHPSVPVVPTSSLNVSALWSLRMRWQTTPAAVMHHICQGLSLVP